MKENESVYKTLIKNKIHRGIVEFLDNPLVYLFLGLVIILISPLILFILYCVYGMCYNVIFNEPEVKVRDKVWAINEEERSKYFRECMELLPKAPNSTVTNHWADVTQKCIDFSTSRAYYLKDNDRTGIKK